EALQVSLNRRVALKVLPLAGALDDRQLQRFRNEALAAAQLHHNGIVPVYYVGLERGIHFYAMQLIDGPSLAAVIQDLKRADVEAAGQPPCAIAKALSAACAPQEATALPAKPPMPGLNEVLAVTSPSTEQSIRARSYIRTAARIACQAAEALEHA